MSLSQEIFQVLEFYSDASPASRLLDGGQRAKDLVDKLNGAGDDFDALTEMLDFAEDIVTGEVPTEEREIRVREITQTFSD